MDEDSQFVQADSTRRPPATAFDRRSGASRIPRTNPPPYLLKPMASLRRLLIAGCVAILYSVGASVGYGSCGDWLAGHSALASRGSEGHSTGEANPTESDAPAAEGQLSGGHRVPCQGYFCRGGKPSPVGQEPVLNASSVKVGTESRCLQSVEIRPSSTGDVLEPPLRRVVGVSRRIERPPKV